MSFMSGVISLGERLISQGERLVTKMAFPESKQIEYLLDLGAWIGDGIKPTSAVEAMININAMNNKQNSMSSKVSESIYNALDSGKEIHHGMEGYFSDHLITIFKSAGSTGLDVTLNSLREDTNALKELRGVFFKPLMLPLSYGLMLFGSAVQVATQALPSIAKGKPVHQWTLEAQQFHNGVYFLLDYAPYAFILMVALAYYVLFFLRNNVGPTRLEIDGLFGFSLYRLYNGNVFLKTLSVMLMSNMTLLEALETIEANSTRYLSYHASRAKQILASGHESLGDVLNTGLITGDVLIRLRILTEVESHESKVEGLRISASRSIEMASKRLKYAGWSVAAVLGVGIVYTLMLAFLALITQSMSR
jgi:type II secretory pathway component PulF